MVSNEAKKQIIEQEKIMWLNTQELWAIRYRVNKRLENKEAAEAAQKEVENCERYLVELEKEIAELNKK